MLDITTVKSLLRPRMVGVWISGAHAIDALLLTGESGVARAEGNNGA
jgi:hypothetical protein